MAYKVQHGSYEIDKIIRPLGRVRLRTGVFDKRLAERYEVMLDDLPLEVVRMILDDVLSLRETYDLWCRGETKLLPTAQLLRPLIATMRDWAATHAGDISASEQEKRLRVIATFEAVDAGARVQELPRLLRALRERHKQRGSQFNHTRSICQAFVRDTLGKRAPAHADVSDVPSLPTPPKLGRHPCTVQEARAIRDALPPRWGVHWWDMCCTSMGPKEKFVDGWEVLTHGVAIHGQKRSARERIVPFVLAPTPGGSIDGFEAALARAGLGVAPYDARRSYERWMQELRFPAYRQHAYMGHGPKSMTELYAWGDIREWLAQDGDALRQYVGEPLQLRVEA
jgi:hypothetical protein